AALVGAAALVAWNLLLIANFVYLIRVDVDPGYLGLLSGQVKAAAYVPRLFASGDAVRSLVLWPVLHRTFDPLLGVSLLLVEAAASALALRLAGVGSRSLHA
ncbi:MAG TPA: hypothetical protein VK131_14155, partial [Candidatus Acidoferrales bacterium]|nr:hypothetical protein [Candidatus Acidoferrales bacterium]